jgi:hypothetical protein
MATRSCRAILPKPDTVATNAYRILIMLIRLVSKEECVEK